MKKFLKTIFFLYINKNMIIFYRRNKYENFFRSNPRLSLMINIYEKKSDEMKKNYEKISEDYILSLYK